MFVEYKITISKGRDETMTNDKIFENRINMSVNMRMKCKIS